MRSGRLLAEESPDALLLRHNMTSLEDVFLTLCRKDGNQSNEDDGESNANRSSMRHRQRKPAAVTNGKNPASGFHQGVDNPAFAQNFNRPDALPGDDDKDASNYDHKSAQPTIVSPFLHFFFFSLSLSLLLLLSLKFFKTFLSHHFHSWAKGPAKFVACIFSPWLDPITATVHSPIRVRITSGRLRIIWRHLSLASRH